jgi:hypothetical protein
MTLPSLARNSPGGRGVSFPPGPRHPEMCAYKTLYGLSGTYTPFATVHEACFIYEFSGVGLGERSVFCG